MSDKSEIEWTDATWNPVTGCSKVSAGCKFCYAERFSERFRGIPGHHFEQGFDLRLWPDRLDIPGRWRRPRKIFVNSMSDLFHEKVPEDFIRKVFEVMAFSTQHTFQVLTKRAERMRNILRSWSWWAPMPLHNIWLGVSAENQETWDSRVMNLLQTPAATRFVSAEPLLGPIGMNSVGPGELLHWIIAGGESGPHARPMNLDWARSLREMSQARGIAYFFKQHGGASSKSGGRELDGRTWDEFPRSPKERIK